MKKYLFLLFFFLLPFISHAQVSSNYFKLTSNVIQPNIATWQFKLPYLGGGGTQCVQVDNNGLFSVGACGGGGGGSSGGTFSTTTYNGLLLQYPYTKLITSLFGNATSTSPWWFDPFSLIQYIGAKVGIGTTTPQEILNLDNTTNSNYTTARFDNHNVTGILDADSQDSFNGITGYTYLGSKSNNPLVLGFNNQGQCGIYSDNTLDTLVDCYPPAGGDEMTYTNSLIQGAGTVFVDNTLMNYGSNTGLNASLNVSKNNSSIPFPTYSMNWWDSALGANAQKAYSFFVASTTENGTYASTTAIALGDVATSSISSTNGVNLAGATIQLISSSVRTAALSVFKSSETAANTLLTVLNSGNVGIGTSSPAQLLDVSGTNQNIRVSNTATGQFQGAGILLNGLNVAGNQAETYIGQQNENTGGTQEGLVINQQSSTGSFINTILKADYNANTLGLYTGGTEGIHIDSSQNVGISSSTPGSLLSIGTTNGINLSTGTSTFSATGGINLANGCFSIRGSCVGGSGGGSGTVTSVGLSDSNSTLTIGSTPITTSGTITATLNLGHTNTWSVLQNFNYASITSYISAAIASTTKAFVGTLTIPNLGTSAGTFLAADPNGNVIATSTPIGASTNAVSLPVQYATAGALPANTYAGGALTEVGTGTLTVDGNNPAVGNRILVKNEVAQTNNGIYSVTATGSGIAAYVLTRVSDYNSSANVIPGEATYVIGGATLDDDWWALTTASPITVGGGGSGSNLTYVETSGGAASVTSVGFSSPSSTLTIGSTPITSSGTITGDLNLGHTNTWTAPQYISNVFGVGTTTTLISQEVIASSTAPQLSLSAGGGIAQWALRNAGGNLYLSTTTIAGTATTSTSALSISGSGFGTTTVIGLNIQGQATSTSNVGVNLTGGCYAVNGTCVGNGGGSVASTAFYNPADPTQYYNMHNVSDTGFNNAVGWDYNGSCSGGGGSGGTDIFATSTVSGVFANVSGATNNCSWYFPSGGSSYQNGSYDYWSGSTPAWLYFSVTYRAMDTNGTNYIGLTNNSGYSDFIGCRAIGSGDWFAVIRSSGTDVATADTGVPNDNIPHRFQIDNLNSSSDTSATANTIRCTVDGTHVGKATGTIPAETGANSGWRFVFGDVATGATQTVFEVFSETIWLRKLPIL